MKLPSCVRSATKRFRDDDRARKSKATPATSADEGRRVESDPPKGGAQTAAPPPYLEAGKSVSKSTVLGECVAKSSPLPLSEGSVQETVKNPPRPLLATGTWKVYHGGIDWRLEREYNSQTGVQEKWRVCCNLLLAVQPGEVSHTNSECRLLCPDYGVAYKVMTFLSGLSCYLKLNFLNADMLQTRDNPFSKVNNSSIIYSLGSPVDELSGEMITIRDENNHIFLKAEPRYRPDDKGIYTIRLKFSRTYTWAVSPRMRFKLCIKGSTMRPDPLDPTKECLENPWSDPVQSDCIDIERTPDMAAETLQLLQQ